MPSSETVELRKVKEVVGDKTDLPSSGPRDSIASLVKATKLSVSGIPSLVHSFGALESTDTATTTAAEIRSMETDGTFLFTGSGSIPAEINKVDLDTFDIVSTITLSSGENYAEGMIIIGDYLYVGLDMGYGNPGIIKKINKDSFEIEASLTLSSGNESIYDLTSEGSYLYAILSTDPGRVTKIDLSTFTEDSTITLAAHYVYPRAAAVYSSYLYIVTTYDYDAVISIDLSTFTVDTYLRTQVTIGAALGILVHDHYLYIPTDGFSILKYDLDDLTYVCTISYSSLASNVCYDIATDGTYLYCGLYVDPGEVLLINIATDTPERVITLETGEKKVHRILIDGLYQYIGLDTDPGSIIRRYFIPSSSSVDRAIDIINRIHRSGTHHIYPTGSAAITITSSATAWVKGSYTEVIPVDTITERFYITGLVINNLVVDSEYEVDIGTGAAASETVVATDTHETHDSNLSKTLLFIPPIEIGANTRVAVRAATQNAVADTCTVKVKYKLN